MTAANSQIITAYDELKMTEEQISEELGYDLAAVKMILLKHSADYGDKSMSKFTSKESEAESAPMFSADEVQLAKDSIVTLARESEMENVRLKASEFIINEYKGRNDPIKNLSEGNFNVLIISEHMSRARAAMARAKARARDVEEVTA